MRALIACLSFSLLAGCVAEVGFDPIGGDATIAGEWTIETQAPTAELCAAHSVTHVRVRFYETRGEGDDMVDVTRDHPDLVFDCALGAFDTSPVNVLRSGEWRMRLLAVNNQALVGDDNVVAMGDEVTRSTSIEAGHVVLPPVDFSP